MFKPFNLRSVSEIWAVYNKATDTQAYSLKQESQRSNPQNSHGALRPDVSVQWL